MNTRITHHIFNPVHPLIGGNGVQTFFTAVLAFAITFTLTACGEHGIEDWLLGSSSSEETGDISSSSADINSGYGMAVASFAAGKTSVIQYELFTVKAQMKNVALDTFPGGKFGAALVDNSDNIIAVIGSTNAPTQRAPNASSSLFSMGCYVPGTVQPGQYKLRMVVKSANSDAWKVAASLPNISGTINFTVAAKGGANNVLAMAVPYKPETVIQNITQYQVEVKKYTFSTKDGRTIPVHYCFPKNNNANAKVLFTIHGGGRNPDKFIDVFKYLSETENTIVIAPGFSSGEFPSYYSKNISNDADTPEKWQSKIIDDIFLDFKQRFSLPNNKYIMYGASNGADFTGLAVMFGESPYLEYAIASNIASFSLSPSAHIRSTPIYKDLINKNLSKRMYILGGTIDPYLEYSNTLGYYIENKEYCKENGLSCNWDLVVMEGVDHDFKKSVPYAIDIIKGIYDAKKENVR
jgi:predicted esterase